MSNTELEQDWIDWFIEQIQTIAKKSKDPSTKVGCLYVGEDGEHLTAGFNGFARKVNDDPALYQDREQKLLRTVHAEANGVANAARTGTRLKNSVVFVTKHPCPQCASLMIQSGVRKVYSPGPNDGSKWEAVNQVAAELLREAEVEFQEIDPTRILEIKEPNCD